jgi:predicted permease
LSTPDFRAAVRRRLSGIDDVDEDVVAELAAQLEDAYAAALERGAGEAQAWQDVESEILGTESWRQLDRYLQHQAPPAARFATRSRTFAAIEDAWRRHGRQAARYLRGDARFAVAVGLTFSLCVGVAAALSTVVHAVVLRPLPFPDPDRVVFMAAQAGAVDEPGSIRSDIPSYLDRRQRLTAFQELAMFRWIDLVFETPHGARRVRGDIGTPSLLRLIGVQPIYGRLFEDGDDEPGAERKIVLSHPLWLELFAGDPAVVGTNVMVDGRPFTVIGIMPPGFGIFRLDARFWIPAVYSAEERADDHRGWLNQYQIGRLRDGATLEDARRELAAFDASEMARFPSLRSRQRTNYHTKVERLRDVMTAEVRPTMKLLLVGALVTLLLGLVNLATLTVARARRDRRDLATRRALGESWRSLAMHLFAQSASVGAIGATGALLVAGALLSGLRGLGLQEVPRAEGLGVELFTVLVCVAAGALASGIMALTPLATLAGMPLVDALHESGDRASTPGARYLRYGLVAFQVAAAFVLTIAMGLTLVSLGNVLSEHPGFSAEKVLTVNFDVPKTQFPNASEAHEIIGDVVDRARRIPGIEAAGVTHLLPFGGRTAALGVRRVTQPRGEEITAWNYVVSSGYFSAMRLPLLTGRYLDERDTAAAEPVIVVSQRLAQRLWPRGNPIGEQIMLPPLATTRPLTVVGVVGDVRQEDLTVAIERMAGATYRTYQQTDERSYALVVRGGGAGGDVPALTGAITGADPRLAAYDTRPMQARVDASLVPHRLAMANATTFAVTALLVAIAGLYAALAYLVVERRREFGVRLVLGSSPRALAYRVTSEGLLVAIAGVVIGLLAWRWLRPWLDPYLYAVDSREAAIVGAAAVLVVVVSVLASLGPARHASRVDPLLTVKG